MFTPFTICPGRRGPDHLADCGRVHVEVSGDFRQPVSESVSSGRLRIPGGPCEGPRKQCLQRNWVLPLAPWHLAAGARTPHLEPVNELEISNHWIGRYLHAVCLGCADELPVPKDRGLEIAVPEVSP